jgi:hypothetical protein
MPLFSLNRHSRCICLFKQKTHIEVLVVFSETHCGHAVVPGEIFAVELTFDSIATCLVECAPAKSLCGCYHSTDEVSEYDAHSALNERECTGTADCHAILISLRRQHFVATSVSACYSKQPVHYVVLNHSATSASCNSPSTRSGR